MNESIYIYIHTYIHTYWFSLCDGSCVAVLLLLFINNMWMNTYIYMYINVYIHSYKHTDFRFVMAVAWPFCFFAFCIKSYRMFFLFMCLGQFCRLTLHTYIHTYIALLEDAFLHAYLHIWLTKGDFSLQLLSLQHRQSMAWYYGKQLMAWCACVCVYTSIVHVTSVCVLSHTLRLCACTYCSSLSLRHHLSVAWYYGKKLMAGCVCVCWCTS